MYNFNNQTIMDIAITKLKAANRVGDISELHLEKIFEGIVKAFINFKTDITFLRFIVKEFMGMQAPKEGFFQRIT